MRRQVPVIGAFKSIIVRFWPVLRLRTILFGVLVLVAALPGLSAIFLRVYENALVRRTEAELIAQSAVIAATAAIVWPGAKIVPQAPFDPETAKLPSNSWPTPQERYESYDSTVATPRDVVDISTEIDLRTSPILPERPTAQPLAGPPVPDALIVAFRLAPVIGETKRVTLSSILLLDQNGALLNFPGRTGHYKDLPEVRQALLGKPQTVLRLNTTYHSRTVLEVFSQAANIRLHHARPIRVNGQVVGVVLVSRSPRALLRGMYEDRGKILFGVLAILISLIGLSAVLGRAIVRPLETLSAASRSLAKGSRQTPKGSSLRVVEIKTLYDDFDAMAQSIDERSRYLRDFAASVSHEFKTPLAGLRGGIELLQDHGETMTTHQRETFLANMAGDTGRLSHLVSRLLDLARADMQAIDLKASANVLDVLKVAADSLSGPQFDVTLEAIKPTIQAAIDTPTLEAILVTIFENARQAGANRAQVHLTQEATQVSLAISNDGPLIPVGDHARIFEPFFTSKRTQGGTGIGLAIARSLVRGYGGTLELVPDQTKVCFKLEIPRALG